MQNTKKNIKKMSSRLIQLSMIVLALSAIGCASDEKKPAKAQAETTKPVATQAAPQVKNNVPPPPPVVEQYALDRLKQMSDNIAAAKAFTYHATHFTEMPAPTGQFLTLTVVSKVALQRPDKLRLNVWGDVPAFDVYFDFCSSRWGLNSICLESAEALNTKVLAFNLGFRFQSLYSTIKRGKFWACL